MGRAMMRKVATSRKTRLTFGNERQDPFPLVSVSCSDCLHLSTKH